MTRPSSDELASRLEAANALLALHEYHPHPTPSPPASPASATPPARSSASAGRASPYLVRHTSSRGAAKRETGRQKTIRMQQQLPHGSSNLDVYSVQRPKFRPIACRPVSRVCSDTPTIAESIRIARQSRQISEQLSRRLEERLARSVPVQYESTAEQQPFSASQHRLRPLAPAHLEAIPYHDMPPNTAITRQTACEQSSQPMPSYLMPAYPALPNNSPPGSATACTPPPTSMLATPPPNRTPTTPVLAARCASVKEDWPALMTPPMAQWSPTSPITSVGRTPHPHTQRPSNRSLASDLSLGRTVERKKRASSPTEDVDRLADDHAKRTCPGLAAPILSTLEPVW